MTGSKFILALSDPASTLELVGGKGESLAKLSDAGLPVPSGFNVTTEAYREFIAYNQLQTDLLSALEDIDSSDPTSTKNASRNIQDLFSGGRIPPAVANAIVEAYAILPGTNPAVAVRSSATAEDLPEASFAGQQETYLNVSSPGAVLEATKKCWASLWTARAISYRARQGISAETISLAVVVQLLVPAEAAGIMFTANPMTGKRDQAVISASWGLGEAVVGGSVTPDTITVDKSSKQVIARETADKQVMTVRVNGGTKEQAVPENLRRVPVLGDKASIDLVQLGIQIEQLYKMPMDIEWTLADGKFAIVQARPITALPVAEVEPPTEWPLPDPKGQYMRASIVDLMPDPLSPLFATQGLGAINRGIMEMGRDLLNFPEGFFLDLMLTINGYAYQKVSYSRDEWWVILSKMVPAFPRLLREGVTYWQEDAHPRYLERANRWREKDIASLSASEILVGINELVDAFAHHLGALMASTMGPSAGSETLFTYVYEKLIQREGDPSAPTFLLGFDSIPIQGEKALYDLASWCKEHNSLTDYLMETTSEQIASQLGESNPPQGVEPRVWEQWRLLFQDYLDQYGYSVYDMDYAKPLPMDVPAPLIETLKLFITGQGKSPYERQEIYREQREQAVEATRTRLRGFKRWAFEKTLGIAQTRVPLREDGITELGLGYPVLRDMLRELGRRFVKAGVIQEANDIFWLEQVEVESMVEALESNQTLTNLKDTVKERKLVWKARKLATPPPQLPPGKKYMGLDIEGVLAGGEGGLEGDVITGVPTSPGKVTATARVLHGPEDFDQMQPGDILVAGITTPAWTPLFAMASGVVTDIGGPLSHGSIVAREYGIPAVMGTGIGTRVIKSGQTVTVDGVAGKVELHSNE